MVKPTANSNSMGEGGFSGNGRAAPFSPFEFEIAFRYLGATRKDGGVALIAIISFAAVMLAVTALIAVMSVMNGFRDQLLSNLLGAQPHIIVDGRGLEPEALDLMLADLEAIDGVRSAGPIVQGEVMASAERGDTFAQVLGMRPGDLARLEVVANGDDGRAATGITHGSLDEFGEGRNGGDVIVLGRGLAQRLGVNAGDYVTLITAAGRQTALGRAPSRKSYYVGGLISVGVSTIDNAVVFMPIVQSQLFFGRGDDIDQIQIRTHDIDAISDLVGPVEDVVLQEQFGRDRYVSDYTRLDPAFFTALQVERMAMRMIMAIVIAIASLNIISGLVMLVKNKRRDIAILRTMGITQASVMRIFVIIGAMIGMMGTLAGIILGILFVINIDPIQDFITWVSGTQVFNPEVYYLYRVPAKLDWFEVGFVSVFCFTVSLLVTLLPAWQASRLDPVEALRYE
ncbi:MAG: lipoprotein-releasing ABC transporter permease subunit [Maricaulis sp.]|nr:lipoprotein-releasing ABC transporter permease subunit [Maricaulis sp.]